MNKQNSASSYFIIAKKDIISKLIDSVYLKIEEASNNSLLETELDLPLEYSELFEFIRQYFIGKEFSVDMTDNHLKVSWACNNLSLYDIF